MKQSTGSAHRILIIEDDADINDIVAAFLSKQGFYCTQAYSGSEARLILESAERAPLAPTPVQAAQAQGESHFPFDLVITDLMLPGLSGNQVVDLIRSKSDLPIIVTSAQDSPAEKLSLFELGVDDYLVKPFDLNELLARITVQLRHVARQSSEGTFAHTSPSQEQLLSFREWLLDPESRQFSVAGDSIKLTRTEFNILEALVRRPSKVYTKQELFEIAWQEESFSEEKAINVHVSNIRSKLKESGTDSYLETVWGIGFKLAD